jgi:hypothetical protein
VKGIKSKESRRKGKTMDESYNGWSNYETWNVALWFGGDERHYQTIMSIADQSAVELMKRGPSDYKGIVEQLVNDYGYKETPDGVSYTDPKLNLDELDVMVKELTQG